MKLDVDIDLYEARQILDAALRQKVNCEIGAISLTSYDKPKLVFHRDDLVEGEAFRHRLVIPREAG